MRSIQNDQRAFTTSPTPARSGPLPTVDQMKLEAYLSPALCFYCIFQSMGVARNRHWFSIIKRVGVLFFNSAFLTFLWFESILPTFSNSNSRLYSQQIPKVIFSAPVLPVACDSRCKKHIWPLSHPAYGFVCRITTLCIPFLRLDMAIPHLFFPMNSWNICFRDTEIASVT